MGRRKPRGGYKHGAICWVKLAGQKSEFLAIIARSLGHNKAEVDIGGFTYQVMLKQIRLIGGCHA